MMLTKAIEQMIETDVDFWIEQKHKDELEQIETGEEEAITSADYNDF